MKSQHYDLLICMRCHDFLDDVLDTSESVLWSVDKSQTKLVYAVDKVHNEFISRIVALKKQDVYVAHRKWLWGVGLFGLLCAAVAHYSRFISFSHFMTIDYDTLFLKKGVDTEVLKHITDPRIGMLGVERDGLRWETVLRSQQRSLSSVLGHNVGQLKVATSLQGGFMTLTQSLLHDFAKTGILRNYEQITSVTQVADDYLTPYIARLHGFKIVNLSSIAQCTWKMSKDPRGLEKQGIYVFHPIKVRSRKHVQHEQELRKYFRKLRKER